MPCLVLALGAAACSPYQVTRRPEPPVSVPPSWSDGGPRPASGGARTDAGRGRAWWRDLGDPELASLVERALRSGYQTRAAWARVREARALADRARASLYPSVDAQLSAARRRQVVNFPRDAFGGQGQGPAPPIPEVFTIETYTATLEGSWQPDVFGAAGANADASRREAEASRERARDTIESVAAEVAQAYFDLVEAAARRELLESQLATTRARLELIQAMYEGGLATALDRLRQRQQVGAAASRLAAMTGAEDLARQRIAVLLGEPPHELRVAVARPVLPAPPPIPDLGVPSDVVARRPDVVAAQKQVEAADQRIGAAVAARFPQIRLQGSIGVGSTEPQSFYENLIYSAMATVTQPIYRGGALSADAARYRAVLEERVATYADTVARALSDVESSLARVRQARARVVALEDEVDAARAALAEADVRYRAGLADVLSVLSAQEALIGAELSLLSARREWLRARVDLATALGGPWVDEVERPNADGTP